jgi:hypothetical protein
MTSAAGLGRWVDDIHMRVEVLLAKQRRSKVRSDSDLPDDSVGAVEPGMPSEDWLTPPQVPICSATGPLITPVIASMAIKGRSTLNGVTPRG